MMFLMLLVCTNTRIRSRLHVLIKVHEVMSGMQPAAGSGPLSYALKHLFVLHLCKHGVAAVRFGR
ncbi:hypothetical protein INR49_005792 [Caranx melampygus]|nr:hypothetical protein INR49_005792 [Caranx melampygus]